MCRILCVLQLTMKDLTRICAADVANVGSDISRLRGFVDSSYAQFALLGVQLMWTTDVQSALEQASSHVVVVVIFMMARRRGCFESNNQLAHKYHTCRTTGGSHLRTLISSKSRTDRHVRTSRDTRAKTVSATTSLNPPSRPGECSHRGSCM